MKKNKSRQRVSSSRNSLNRRASPQQKKPSRKPRVLWFNSYCLLDTSSGASISARQILKQLSASGYEVKAVGATIFDDPKGAVHLEGTLGDAISRKLETCSISDGDLSHYLLVTKSPTRENITFSELNNLYSLYASALNTFKPDLVFFYGGTSFDLHIPAEARIRGIPSAAYLVNSNYLDSRWCRDVDLIVTDTQATSDFYRERQGFVPVPVGKFIDLGKVIAPDHKRHYATLINPSWAKGAGIVAMLAVLLEERRPDIVFEVVESRGSWSEVVRNVTRSVWGIERSELKNVIVTPNTDNISEVYGRSRIVLGLSQWWESGSRVLAEAMLNGIPAMVSNHGGSPEMVGEGGIVVDLPPSCHEAPYNSMPRPELLGELVQFLERVWDDEPFYLNLMVRALQQGNKLHRMEVSTQRLLEAFQPLVEKRAGDKDFQQNIKNLHKHKMREQESIELKSPYVRDQKIGQTAVISKNKEGHVEKRVTSKHPGLFEREIFWLTELAGCQVPKLLTWSLAKKTILMSDVGESLTEENAPSDWEKQLEIILKVFAEKKCRHNDLTPEEICVSNGRLSVVDFGWASIGHDFSCGGRVPFFSKERLFLDEDALDRVRFRFQRDFAGTDFVCCFSWGSDEITRSELVQRGAINVQSFQLRGSLLQQVKQRLSGTYFEHLNECGAFETGSLQVSICIFDQRQDIFEDGKIGGIPDFSQGQRYCSINLAEAREMVNATTFFREEFPYVLWRHWWNGAFDKSEIAGAEFQDKRQGIENRWDCISFWLNANGVRAGIALDIGSNLGDSCIRLSSAGFKVIGVEPDPKVFRESLSRTAGYDVSIYHSEATPEFFNNFHRFDLVLALSVLHRVWALKGRSEAERVLRMAAERSNFIVIEGACSLDRFSGEFGDVPLFHHNDIASSTAWHLKWFGEILSTEWCFERIGVVQHTSSEPLRILFGAKRLLSAGQSVECPRRSDDVGE